MGKFDSFGGLPLRGNELPDSSSAHWMTDMRRNEFDVADKVQTTVITQVRDEVAHLFRSLYDEGGLRVINSGFERIEALYEGRDPGYHACDTAYHDIQHVLDVTLAMARLMDGYERSRREGTQKLAPELFSLGVITALFHDFGYLRRRNDRRHRHGAEYTLTHVTRGSVWLRENLGLLGLQHLAPHAATLIHFTGYERSAESIRVPDEIHRRIGQMLGTADIIAQMADRCYLEKCRDRLFPEFVLGGLATRTAAGGKAEVVFSSGDDLVRKTPGFYVNAQKRLDHELDRSYEYAERYFGGQNLYLEEILKNVHYAAAVAKRSDDERLRRHPPSTLSAQPADSSLVIR